MPQPIGSVYLDQPRQSRGREPAGGGKRAKVAGQLTFLGLAGVTVAGLLMVVRAVVGSPDPIVGAVQGTLEDPDSRAAIQEELATAIEGRLLTPELLDLAEMYEIDHEAEIDAWAAAVLDDPDFSDGVGELIVDVHGRIFVEPRPDPIDVGPLTDTVIGHAEETAPALAPLLPPGTQIVSIDGSGLPDLSTPMAALDRAIVIALVASAALPLAFALHDQRHLVVASVGRWFLVVGVILGLGVIGLPWVAKSLTGWVIVEEAVRPASIRLLAPAALAGMTGIGLASLAAVWRRRARRKVTREGANAWLEVVEPPPVAEPPSRQLDLARRGLVDGSRHLTNI